MDTTRVPGHILVIKTESHSGSTPKESAKEVGLRYVSDHQPGIRREQLRNGFRYRSATGRLIRDRATLRRIAGLVIPPAWKEVWICASENGHLQVTGRDDRNRKQHIYHPRWRAIRDQTKFHHLLDFGRALPRIRARLRRDLARRGLCREKVLATIVSLLEKSLIRVGNEDSARENHTYGLTTMKNRHAHVRGARIQFRFRGKSGKEHIVELEDSRVAGIVRACQELPGQELFQYVDDADQRHDVGSGDVNDYLREMTGCNFTAKDFRTWAGTVSAIKELRRLGAATVQAQCRKNIVAVIRATAECLGNTAAICRKSYIHPAILEAYVDGSLIPMLEKWNGRVKPGSTGRLRADEALLIQFLKAMDRL